MTLASLQKSIDLLTAKHTETLDENVRLQADNARLLANQQIMAGEDRLDEPEDRPTNQTTQKYSE